jgi:hypothetical protein
LKSETEWRNYCKSGNKPIDIPANPSENYKEEWKGVGDFLGTNRIADRDKVFRNFNEARDFVRTLNLKGQADYQNYSKSGKKPKDIPTSPAKTYKNEWKGFGDFLGTGNIASKDRVYRSFGEAREFARTLNLKGQSYWKIYSKSGNKPEDIPTNPGTIYKEDWKGFGDFLGTGNISNKDRIFRSFNEAKVFVRTLNLKSETEWRNYCKSGEKPNDIPSNPNSTYKTEWKGVADFLGKE